MKKAELIEVGNKVGDIASTIWDWTLMGGSTLAAGGGAAYGVYTVRGPLTPDMHGQLGEIANHVVEALPIVAAGGAAAAAGFVVGLCMADSYRDEVGYPHRDY